jgi:hypothetical protein
MQPSQSFKEDRTMNIIKAAAVVGLSALSLSAFATTSTPRIDQRQAEQQQRIEQGVRSGQLTRREAGRLQQGQANIQRLEDRAVADGKVTPRESARIERAQDVEDRRISREKHDGQVRR